MSDSGNWTLLTIASNTNGVATAAAAGRPTPAYISTNQASTKRRLPIMARGLLVEEHPDKRPKLQSKWPKERKPQLAEVMRDVAVLKRAVHLLSEPVYIFGDDAKDYFN
ncbi:hypothetical protein AB1Y20_010283 [Prymnesium parvum]|uniref:Uncharacterized protein n=1 Tax=Prymnesium parvum TaxID=97485 RepID=A0AB34K6X9_PRYPA